MLRVALVDPSLFTLPYDLALAGGLTANDHEVTLYGRGLPAVEDMASTVNIVPHFYTVAEGRMAAALPRALRLGIKGIDHVVSMRSLAQRLRRERPDVIHFQWLPLPLADRHLLSRFTGLASLVLTVHDTDPFNGSPAAFMQGSGMAGCFGVFDRLIVHTTQGKTRLQAKGVDPARIALIAHGLLEPLPSAPPPDPFDGEVTLLLFGKIKPYKGLDMLIEAFAQLPPALRNQARIRVVGKPFMDLAPLLERARALGVTDRLTIEPRFVPDTDVGALFGAGTIAVFPYREIEASGVFSLALAHGRPVIASALGSFKDLLEDGLQGVLVPPGDAAALTAALARLLADRAFARRCMVEARNLAQSVPSWQDIGQQTTAVYQQAAS